MKMKVKRSEATQWKKSSVNEELNGMWMIDGNHSLKLLGHINQGQ